MPGFLKAIREAAAAAPVNQDLVFTRRKLWDDIERTLWALETAQNHFEQATEPSLIDCYLLSYVSFGDNRSSKDKRADRGDRPV